MLIVSLFEIKEGAEFRTLVDSSPVYVRMQERDGKIGYRHKITDFPNKPHYYDKPTRQVIKIN